MQAFLTLTRRELGGFFYSWIGYVVIAGAMFLMGLSFVALLAKLQMEPTPMPLTEIFLNFQLLGDRALFRPCHHHAALRPGKILRHV